MRRPRPAGARDARRTVEPARATHSRSPSKYDATVVGAGPNGLAAAIRLAGAGRRVLLLEAADRVGGGCASAELTLPGFTHDICSAVHPLAAASPYLSSLPLARHGLEWIEPPVALAHPFDEDPPALLFRSIDATAAGLGADGPAYRGIVEPLVDRWRSLAREIFAPIAHVPRHPLLLARFGRHALRPARAFVHARFRDDRTRALFAGIAAHSLAPLDQAATTAFGLVLALAAHVVGWPIARGGTQRVADALAAHFRELGGTILTNSPVHDLDALPPARATVLDVTPRQLLDIAGDRLPAAYRRRLDRYRYGPGVFKIDWALSDPIPWRHADCARAGTLHLGGTYDEIEAAERLPWEGRHAERPFVLLSQPTLFDARRAPDRFHVAWAYCHVPHGSTRDMTEAIEAQVERFAPGFRSRILARHTMTTRALEAHDPNLVGGDIAAGANTVRQVLFRPVPARNPYATPVRGLYLCSAATPPGGGVHGMCGKNAADAVLRDGP